MHGAAGDIGRERFGDSGLLAGDLPEGMAIARRRLAGLAERGEGKKGLGFGSRERVAAAMATAPSAADQPAGTDPRGGA
jgi:hypothetical protein